MSIVGYVDLELGTTTCKVAIMETGTTSSRSDVNFPQGNEPIITFAIGQYRSFPDGYQFVTNEKSEGIAYKKEDFRLDRNGDLVNIAGLYIAVFDHSKARILCATWNSKARCAATDTRTELKYLLGLVEAIKNVVMIQDEKRMTKIVFAGNFQLTSTEVDTQKGDFNVIKIVPSSHYYLLYKDFEAKK